MAIEIEVTGLHFPAAPVASSDPTMLDEYREGTWTPVPAGLTVVNGTGGVTYAGSYTKIGRLVFVTLRIIPSGTATTASTATVTNFSGLPFTPSGLYLPVPFVDANVVSLGIGMLNSGGANLYSPTWSARNAEVSAAFVYYV